MTAVLTYLAGKTLRLATLLVAVCALSFWLMHISPIDPVQAYVGADMMLVSPDQRAAIAERWGLDEPPVEQFVLWATSLARGDMGTSMIYRQPVSTVIGERFLASLALMGTAWTLSGVFGFVLGVIAGRFRGTLIDRVIRWYCLTLASTPAFWLGLLLLMVFAVWLGLLPVGLASPAGMLAEDVTWLDRLRHLVLPALTLSIIGVANIALHTRQKLIDVLASDYAMFARARGESETGIILRHGLRNVALPALTLQFVGFSELFGGAVIAEQVFSYPGLGQATVQAGLHGDVPLLLGAVIVSTLFVFVGNLVADLLYRAIDPRTRAKAPS
ncbi:MAG: ABC transporter permease [Actinobacteria bacterium]|nr:ABC transporter permease [Actinomycetota bacterium]